MKRIVLCLTVLLLFSVPSLAFAYDPLTPACKDTANTNNTRGSVACSAAGQTSNPLTGPDGTLMRAERLIAIIAGIAAILVIIVNGLKFVTSQGDPQGVSKARTGVMYALIGLLVIIVAQSIIELVIRGVT